MGEQQQSSKRGGRVVVTAGLASALAGVVAWRRRRQPVLEQAATGIHDTAAPPVADDEKPLRLAPAPDEAHAPGHRHLGPPPSGRAAALAHRAWRPWPRRAERSGHPGKRWSEGRSVPR